MLLYVIFIILKSLSPDSAAVTSYERLSLGVGVGGKMYTFLGSGSFETVNFSLLFDMVSAFPVYTINNCIHLNERHGHNLHSIVPRIYTSKLMERQSLKSHSCPEMSQHTDMSLRAAWETLGSLNVALIIFPER